LEERLELRVLAGGTLFAHKSHRISLSDRQLQEKLSLAVRRKLKSAVGMLSKTVMEATITRLLFSRIISL